MGPVTQLGSFASLPLRGQVESRELAGPWGPQSTGELPFDSSASIPVGLVRGEAGQLSGAEWEPGGLRHGPSFLTGDAGCLGWGWTKG